MGVCCSGFSVLECSPMLEFELELRLRIWRVRTRVLEECSESVALLDTLLGTPFTYAGNLKKSIKIN